MDVLSEVLGAIRLTGAVFLEMELRAQWAYLTAPARMIADVLMPDADHVMPFHLVTEGTCYARKVDVDPAVFSTGDLNHFPAGDQHVHETTSGTAVRLKQIDIKSE